MKCRRCGGEIQATEKRYYTFRDGALRDAGLDSDWEYYCELDHPVEDTEQFTQLVEALVVG